MKAYKEIIRKYYKYQAWTQPVLTGYTTSTDLGNITVSATSDYGGNCQAWKIMIGSVSSTVDNNYWQLANSNNQESLTLIFPYKLKISSLKITTRPSDNYTRSIGIFNSKGIQIGSTVNCNAALTEYTLLSNGSTITNTLTITVFAGSNSYFGLQNLQIVAQRIIESTSSDYDFYKDIDVYSLHKESSSGIYPVDKTVVNLRSGTQSLNLKAGTEGYIEIVGAGGRECQIWNGWNYRSNGGGSGGRFSCNFVATANVTLNFTCGVRSGNNNPGGASYIDVSGSRFATANGGQTEPREVAPGGAGGTASYTAISGLTLSNIQTITGNTGASVVNANPGNATSVASTGTYGKGGSGGYNGPANDEENGWCYVHYTKEYTTVDTYKAFNV